ncbi:MAG: hypothetical protein ACREPT_13650 [Rudaea sp.]
MIVTDAGIAGAGAVRLFQVFATNTPGIFAGGDINTYPGRKELVLSGFLQATLAAFGMRKCLLPDAKMHLQ